MWGDSAFYGLNEPRIMNRNDINSRGLWVRARPPFPTCADRDEGLIKLEKELMACCESRGNGLPKYGCWSCPHREACEKLWGRASTQSSVRKLLREEVKRFKRQFALIKGG